MKVILSVLALTVSTARAVSCSTLSLDECAYECECSRIACCCGDNCQRGVDGETIFNKCVHKNTLPVSWGCPSEADCAAGTFPISPQKQECSARPEGGSAVTGAPGPVDNTQPVLGPNGLPALKFGTSFPMIGTQLVPKHTWQNHIFMGTNMKFNDGAFWSYTDSFYVPSVHETNGAGVVVHPGSGSDNDGVTSPPTPPPSPAVDFTGTSCYGYLAPCPSGFYCKVFLGYQPLQQGTCQKSMDTTGWGAGNTNSLPGGTSPTANPFTNMDISQFPAGDNWFSNALAESCAPPSVCGFKSVGGECWCDASCEATGDCCADVESYCTVDAPTPAPVPTVGYTHQHEIGGEVVECSNHWLAGDCTGNCNAQPVTSHGGRCFCDQSCELYNDCCCNYKQVCY